VGINLSKEPRHEGLALGGIDSWGGGDADATAAIRLKAIGQRRKFLAELERLKELERAGRVPGRGRGG
jgi:hypothetical protein